MTLLPPNQVSFISGRQSIDNVAICQKIIHTLKYTNTRRRGMVLKLDLEKNLRQNGVAACRRNFAGRFATSQPRQCRYGAISQKILPPTMEQKDHWHDQTVKRTQTRDPMSPYIFILCMKKLNQWISAKVEEGAWRPLRTSRGWVKISYLFFADDILLFAEDDVDQIVCIKEGLRSFCKAAC